MTKEFAKELDEVLAGCIANGGQYESNDGEFSSVTLGDRLKSDGYGQWLSGNEFRIFPQGVDFFERMGGYTAQFLKQNEMEQLKKQNLLLQNNELEYNRKIRKQKSIIRLWQVVSAVLGILSLILLIFKFFNPFS